MGGGNGGVSRGGFGLVGTMAEIWLAFLVSGTRPHFSRARANTNAGAIRSDSTQSPIRVKSDPDQSQIR
eukprot:10446786-Lingulodinium_polyedra.AAC.1